MNWLAVGVVAAGVILPVGYLLAHGSRVYDTIRHLLFVIPPLACLQGVAMAWLMAAISQLRHPAARAVCFGVPMLALASVVYDMVRLHPHQYVYYNQLIGGVSAAQGRFELDYWGNSLREASLELGGWASKSLEPGPGAPYRVHVCGPRLSAAYYLPPGFQVVPSSDPADFVIALNRNRCIEKTRGTEILRVERLGAVLSVVKRTSAGRAADPRSSR